jgi:hypothetical protein
MQNEVIGNERFSCLKGKRGQIGRSMWQGEDPH